MGRAAARAAANGQAFCGPRQHCKCGIGEVAYYGPQTAALTIGVQIEFVFARTEGEIDAAFAELGGRSQGLIIHPDSLFTQHREKLAALAIREKLPALYSTRNFPEAAG